MNSTHVSFPGLGIENLPIHRIAFNLQLFGHEIPVYYYGITFALGFLLALVLALRQARRFGIDEDDLLDYFLLAVPFSLIGARLYYVAFTWESFRDNPLRILNTRYGGMAYYGGVIGGILAFLLMSRLKKMNFLHLLDYFAPYLALGQGIGRWGNFFNQEAFGENTTLPWGMFSEGTQSYLEAYGHGLDPALPVHPTFLYEFLGNLLIFFILLHVRKKKKFVFEVSAWYFVLYGLLRFLVEGIRVDALMWGNIRVSRLLSLLMVISGLTLILIKRGQLKQGKRPMPPIYAGKVPVPAAGDEDLSAFPTSPDVSQPDEVATEQPVEVQAGRETLSALAESQKLAPDQASEKLSLKKEEVQPEASEEQDPS